MVSQVFQEGSGPFMWRVSAFVFYGKDQHDVFRIDAEREFGYSSACGKIFRVAEYTQVTRQSVQYEGGARVLPYSHDLFYFESAVG